MAPLKKAEPVAGQRSIQAFFTSKPKASEPVEAAPAPKPAVEVAAPPAKSPTPAQKTAPVATATAAPSPPKGTKKASSNAQEHVGKGIRVYWPAEDAWFEGRVTRFDSAKGKHHVKYEDGDSEWVDFSTEKIEFLAAPTDNRTKKNKSKGSGKSSSGAGKAVGKNIPGNKKKRPGAVIGSDSDDDGVAAMQIDNNEEEGDAAASGSEYEASDPEDSDEESLVDEESSGDEVEMDDEDEDLVSMGGSEDLEMELEDEDLEDKSPPAKQSKGKNSSKSSKASNGGVSKTGRLSAVTPGTAKASAQQRTSGVALSNGVSITPNTVAGKGANATPAVPRPVAGHAPAPASAMRNALDKAAVPSEAINAAATASDASRFVGRDAARFPFLHPDKIKDAARRRPGDPGYDPTTLYIPPDWFKTQKISEGQRQWWDFKAGHWGSVVLFKMGKFYELFEMDANVGAECLGLSYMKGDQPHVGFPEAAYAQMAERLARAGHRVLVVEQVETPDMLAVRNEQRKKQGLKKDNVVAREKVAVLTRGTLTDADMMGQVPDAQYLLAVAETPLGCGGGGGSGDGRDKVIVGAAAVDAATGQLLVGQWYDDDLRSRLRGVLTALQPVEVVLPRGGLSDASRRVLLGVLRSPLVNELHVGSAEKEFWGADETWRRLKSEDYFAARGGEMPAVLAALAAEPVANASAANALGGCLSYLRTALLDRRVLGAGRVESLDAAVAVGAQMTAADADMPAHMTLDGPALENLEILENTEGGIVGTLLAALDHCTTPFGRRRLRQWLCRPLCRIADITARQDAVANLIGPAEDAACAARRALSGLSDVERALARLGAAGAGLGNARDSPRVVLYEDVSKKRVNAFLGALRALERVMEAVGAFEGCGATSKMLLDLVTPGRGTFPLMEAPLADLRGAADWDEAEKTGRVVPASGVDPAYDAAETAVSEAEAALAEYLKSARQELGAGKEVKFVSLNKDSHVLEVPEDLAVPREWESMQGKKGVKRYITAELKELVGELDAAHEAKESAQSGILQGILRQFAERRDVWAAAVDAVAQLDALMSLAVAASCGDGPMARPQLLPWKPLSSEIGAEGAEAVGATNGGGPTTPVFRARGLRHPAGIGGSGGTFVPNDVVLGGDQAPFVVLTGPNMGGKSTLMRQVCLASVAAQVGAWVPAESLELTPTDAVFVRMGARDRIMLGQSTFFVELSETAAALARATPWSLVALDELGRGTSTHDGAAIASAVLDRLASGVRCRGVFATHYHHIADAHANDPAVAIKHMGCAVTAAEETGGVEEVTFLYRLMDGACPKSYGVNVARLAGLPEEVVRRAAVVSVQAEERGAGGGGTLGTFDGTAHGTAHSTGTAAAPMEIDGSGGENSEDLEGLRWRVVTALKEGAVPEEVKAVWESARRELGL